MGTSFIALSRLSSNGTVELHCTSLSVVEKHAVGWKFALPSLSFAIRATIVPGRYRCRLDAPLMVSSDLPCTVLRTPDRLIALRMRQQRSGHDDSLSPALLAGFFMAMQFDDSERAAVYRAIYERRDMRHFVRKPVDAQVLARLIDAAHHAPSVGFMQPWRILRITDEALRKALHDAVERERARTAEALGERSDEFMKLKVEGMLECGELLVMALMDGREKHVFGRRTMPEMDLASVACAIQNMWLAARAEGLGMGWVSLFEVDDVRRLLHMPAGAKPVAILCLGHVEHFYPRPMLEIEHWAQRVPVSDCVFENEWPSTGSECGKPD